MRVIVCCRFWSCQNIEEQKEGEILEAGKVEAAPTTTTHRRQDKSSGLSDEGAFAVARPHRRGSFVLTIIVSYNNKPSARSWLFSLIPLRSRTTLRKQLHPHHRYLRRYSQLHGRTLRSLVLDARHSPHLAHFDTKDRPQAAFFTA